jgi:hypothetical protein
MGGGDDAMKATDRTTIGAGIVAAVLFGAYLSGYICFGDEWRPRGPGTQLRMRVYGHEWAATVFRPAGWVESRIRGQIVQIGTQDDLRLQSP